MTSGIAREVVRSYRHAGGNDTGIEPTDLGPSLMTGLDWIAFNMERAIGLRAATAAETAQARKLAPQLLATMPDQVSAATRIGDTLRL